MSDPIENSNTRLEQLVEQIMKEKDPAKYDELGAEIWRVLKERERIADQPPLPSDKTH